MSLENSTATAVTGLIAHTVSMALRMKGFLDDCKMQLKHKIEDFEEKLLQEVIDNVKQLEAGMLKLECFQKYVFTL